MENKKVQSCCAASREKSEEKDAEIYISPTSSEISHENMVRLPGGNFLMGTEDKEGFPLDGEGPVREISLDPFYIDVTDGYQSNFFSIYSRNRIRNRCRTFWMVICFLWFAFRRR